jgi:2-polyprenyl-3-methyl-5-hydroxy-6-metoxy-1,4-benzoquinol methylase
MFCFMKSPDGLTRGFLDFTPQPNGYENTSTDPDDVAVKISSLIKLDARVLDVGCGTGSISEIIRKMTRARLVCIEPDAERAAIASSRGLRVFQTSVSEEFLREHGPFDTIVLADVLEHLPDSAEMVSLLKQGMVPDGSIVASVPNVAHWYIRIDLLRGRFN